MYAWNPVVFTPSQKDNLFPGLTPHEKENFFPGHLSYTSPTPVSHPELVCILD
jgi:hypothetical protein